jgi:polar amino acid transport system substrate-binding protein
VSVVSRRPQPAVLSLLLIGVLLALGISISSCGGSDLSASGKFTPRTPGVLTVATSEIPNPGFWTGTFARPTGGFEYELARALASRFGLARVRVIEVPFDHLISGELGGADLALSDITVTSERARHVAFSSGYLSAPPAVLVRPGTSVPDEHTAQRLSWAVQAHTTLQSVLSEAIEPTRSPLVLAHQREALAALRSRRVQAVMLDLPIALAYARESPHSYAVAAQLSSDEDMLAAALPHGSGENLEAVDSALRAFSSDGTIERLGHIWLHTDLQDGRAEAVPLLRTEE